jgi:hypothetical protein
MGFLFRSEATAATHSITTLLKRDNPAIRSVVFLASMLHDLENDFWFLYSYNLGWTAFQLQLALNTTFRLVALRAN